VLGSVPEPPLEEVPVEEPVVAELADAFFARAAAFGPSAGSLPAAIWAAISPPIRIVAAIANTASFAVSALVD
jgi:hypothetical protein